MPALSTHALDTLNVSLDHLVKLVEDGGLETFDDTQLVGFVQGFERLRNRLPLIDQPRSGMLNADLPDPVVPVESAAHVGGPTLRISVLRRHPAGSGPPTASAEQMSMTGEPLQPVRPLLAAAQRTGQISPEQVGIVERRVGEGGSARVRPGRHRGR